MKIHGKTLDGPNVEVLVIPRQSGDVVFRARAVLDYEPFEKLCPVPSPPQVMIPGGTTSTNVEDPGYIQKLNTWAGHKTDWMVIKSLEATDGLEWENVDPAKMDTWGNYRNELVAAGFTPGEISRVVQLIVNANGLSQEKIDEATERFLATAGAQLDDGPSPSTGLKSTPSGEPAKDS